MKIQKKRVIILLILTVFIICISCTGADNYVSVKYRDTPVNIGSNDFEYLNTDGSSWIRGAWYDSSNRYMVIKLENTYYHYCGLPINIWNSFKVADSYGTFYNQYIKGNYDCRHGFVPEY